jgi:hypothetical protein
MYAQTNVGYLQIGASVAATTAGINAMNAGEIGIFTPEGVRMTEALAATEARFIVVNKLADGSIVSSPVYNKSAFKSANVKAYAAATQQVDYIGFNGTSGSIDVINNNQYKINIQVQELLRSNTDGRKTKFGIYQSDASATQSEIALGLASSLFSNFLREAEKFITFKAICDDAGDALGTGMDAMTFTKGSKIVTATDVDDATTNPALVVGGFLRAGTTVTSDVYKIVAIDATANTITLDAPFRGESLSGVDTAYESITAADGAAANWGVALTGGALGYVTGKENYEVAMWETQLVDFGNTTNGLKTTKASRGTGVPNQVAQMEWFYQGNEGEVYREGFSTIHSARTNVVSAPAGNGYDLINMTFAASDLVSFSNNVSPSQLILAIPTDASGATYAIAATANDITDVLEALAGTSIVAAGGLAIT